MRINSNMKFPHPVLCTVNDDYTGSSFAVEVEIDGSSKTDTIVLNYRIILDNDEIIRLIKDGQAEIRLFMTCKDTYYNHSFVLEYDCGTYSIKSHHLHGKVALYPVVVSCGDIANFKPLDLHEEYEGYDWNLVGGDVLAIGDGYDVLIDYHKLAPINTIFQIDKNNDVKDGEFSIMYDNEKIAIQASENTYNYIHQLRKSNSRNKAVCMNSVYLPAVISVLHELSISANDYEGRHWYKVFTAKCEHHGIDYKKPKLLEDAQTLLNSPFKNIEKLGVK